VFWFVQRQERLTTQITELLNMKPGMNLYTTLLRARPIALVQAHNIQNNTVKLPAVTMPQTAAVWLEFLFIAN